MGDCFSGIAAISRIELRRWAESVITGRSKALSLSRDTLWWLSVPQCIRKWHHFWFNQIKIGERSSVPLAASVWNLFWSQRGAQASCSIVDPTLFKVWLPPTDRPTDETLFALLLYLCEIMILCFFCKVRKSFKLKLIACAILLIEPLNSLSVWKRSCVVL